VVRKVRALEAELADVDNDALRQWSFVIQDHLADGEQPVEPLLPEAYALVSETIFRKLGLRAYDVQLLGAIALHEGYVAEMQTGEGKTLTAMLPVYLNALSRGGVHVATANDYLARRDAEWTRPVFEALGLSVGFVQSQMPGPQRLAAYECDVTYGTAKEFGFDFLRDRLLERPAPQSAPRPSNGSPTIAPAAPSMKPVQRSARFALVDEADSILIDEATTPLIISASLTENTETDVALYRWAADAAREIDKADDGEPSPAQRFVPSRPRYNYNEATATVRLTSDGQRWVQSRPPPELLAGLAPYQLHSAVERAIKVDRDFLRDRQYIVRDEEVVIVDEFTGRLGEGRKWRGGIHQAVEAKEGLPITVAGGHSAKTTMPELFARYPRVAGMTGTAHTSRREFRQSYGLPVVRIPTHRPCRRVALPDKIFVDENDKWSAVVEEVAEIIRQGRPVLIGTRSIDKSEHISQRLATAGIAHNVLNAKQDEDEAAVVAQAGERGAVTVATNMAGRGTDIKLGDGVAELGGLHVICTELHESARIDRQLTGRSARQGDPGSFRRFLSLEDEILTAGLGQAKAEQLGQSARRANADLDALAGWLYDAQEQVEAKRFATRQMLLESTRRRAEWISEMGLDPNVDLFDVLP
jgi:preprotein translocase subunit SecA